MKRGHETAGIASGGYIIVADLRRAVPFQSLLRICFETQKSVLKTKPAREAST